MTKRRNRPAVNWPLLRAQVVKRDLYQMWLAAPNEWTDGLRVSIKFPFEAWVRQPPIVCIARIVDPDAGPCSGRTTLDHVKPEPRMGVKAEDVIEQLVSVCQGHSEDGMKAGHQWNTAHRAEEREYLRRIYG